MTSESGAPGGSGQDSVVLASFESYRAAEHMVGSLGGEFRRKARKGGARVVVIRGNPDGSLKVTESRVLSGSDLVATVMRVSVSMMIGFMGLWSALKGGRSEARAARARKGHVGSEEKRAHEILADAGPGGTLVLVRCKDEQTRGMVAAAVAEGATASWDGRLSDFLAALDPGPTHDWVRAALGEHTGTTG